MRVTPHPSPLPSMACGTSCSSRRGAGVPRPGERRHSFQQEMASARIAASVNAATPLVVGDEVFITSSYNTGAALCKVTKDAITEIWANDETLSCHYDTPVRHEGFLYGVDGRQEEGGRLRCVEWKTGKVRWTVEGFGCASAIVADGRLILLTEAGDLVLADATAEKYRELARATLFTGPCRAHPALANGRLYTRDSKQLACWNLGKN